MGFEDSFEDVPLADAETHTALRKLHEERLVGSYILPSPHIDVAGMMLAEEVARAHSPLIILGGGPGLGKSIHDNPFAHESAAARETREELGYGRGLMGLGYSGMGVYDYQAERFTPYRAFDYPVLQDEKKLPEWQQRLNRSKDAKQVLIDNLKAKRAGR